MASITIILGHYYTAYMTPQIVRLVEERCAIFFLSDLTFVVWLTMRREKISPISVRLHNKARSPSFVF